MFWTIYINSGPTPSDGTNGLLHLLESFPQRIWYYSCGANMQIKCCSFKSGRSIRTFLLVVNARPDSKAISPWSQPAPNSAIRSAQQNHQISEKKHHRKPCWYIELDILQNRPLIHTETSLFSFCQGSKLNSNLLRPWRYFFPLDIG